MKITAFDTKGQIERIQGAGYPIPKSTTVERLAKVWVEVLEGVDANALKIAVGAFLRDGAAYFPKPGQIRERAIRFMGSTPTVRRTDLRSRYIEWEGRHDGPCPVCHATVRLLTAEERSVHNGGTGAKRFGVLHDRSTHEREGIPWAGYPIVDRGAKETESGGLKRIGPGSAA